MDGNRKKENGNSYITSFKILVVDHLLVTQIAKRVTVASLSPSDKPMEHFTKMDIRRGNQSINMTELQRNEKWLTLQVKLEALKMATAKEIQDDIMTYMKQQYKPHFKSLMNIRAR